MITIRKEISAQVTPPVYNAMRKENLASGAVRDNAGQELLTALREWASSVVKANGGTAGDLATALVKFEAEVLELFCGQLIYLPKNHAARVAARRAAIVADFNGQNQMALARKYKLSYQSVYRILAEDLHKRAAKAKQSVALHSTSSPKDPK